jgi:CheY-like chemotaxis protein
MPSTVMIVEDDRELQELYSFMLEGTGCHIVRAYDGKEALDMMAECAPDLIVLDMLLDEMMGDEFFVEMRAVARYAAIPVVVASVLPRERCRGVLDQDCRVVYLRKPFRRGEFVQAVQDGLA